jgi:hypothetical protein
MINIIRLARAESCFVLVDLTCNLENMTLNFETLIFYLMMLRHSNAILHNQTYSYRNVPKMHLSNTELSDFYFFVNFTNLNKCTENTRVDRRIEYSMVNYWVGLNMGFLSW